jgi:replicative DNA helicase
VLFIYRDDVYDSLSERRKVADIIVTKNNDGPMGDVELFFQTNPPQFKSARIETVLRNWL